MKLYRRKPLLAFAFAAALFGVLAAAALSAESPLRLLPRCRLRPQTPRDMTGPARLRSGCRSSVSSRAASPSAQPKSRDRPGRSTR